MKIIATSDFHGYLPEITTPFDLLLICGDVCPAYCHGTGFQMDWLTNEFSDWVNHLPFKDENSKVILTWGNHDFIGEIEAPGIREEIESASYGRLRILVHEPYTHMHNGEEIKIFATPYCAKFCNWAFMRNNYQLGRKYAQIPDGLDILMSHDSPTMSHLGDISEGNRKSTTTGNRILNKHIKRAHPKLFISGHFHTGNHKLTDNNGILMANVSYINERYEPAFNPLELDFDEKSHQFNTQNNV